MSYDLMVFNPGAAPGEAEAFVAWYEEEMAIADEEPSDPDPLLQAWYLDMIKVFPNMQDPSISDEDTDNPKLTGYSWTDNIIYADFRWSETEVAYKTMFALAQKHRLGFFDVSGDGTVWHHTDKGGYEAVLRVSWD